MARQPSPNVKKLIEGHEARIAKGYYDVARIPTAGVGHTGPDVKVGVTYSAAQIDAWFDEDIAEAVATIARFVKAEIIEALPEQSYDALVSFIFNVGAQAFRNPKTGKETNFSKAINGRRFDEVDDRMRDWVYAGGRRIGGLASRRADESARWNRGFEAVAAVGPMPEPEPLAPPVHAFEAAETNVVPDTPEPAPMSGKDVLGISTVIGGAVAAVGPETVISAGTQLRSLVPDIPLFNVAGAVLIGFGIGLIIWNKVRRSRQSGA